VLSIQIMLVVRIDNIDDLVATLDDEVVVQIVHELFLIELDIFLQAQLLYPLEVLPTDLGKH